MKQRNILSRTLLAVVIGAAAFGAQAADDQARFYAGAGVGQSFVDESGIDDEDTAFSAFAGYQFNRYFSLEAGYADFGELEANGTPVGLEASSAYFTAVGSVPFTDRLSGYAKAGVHRWDLDTALPGLTGAEDSGSDPTYGLGLQYRFTDSVALRGEYSRFEIEDADVDLAQLQVRFDF